jgi:hypothetical protein
MDSILKGIGVLSSALLPRTKTLSNNELLATFQTITALLNLLQSTQVDQAKVDTDTDLSQAIHGDLEHRNLTALAILLVRELDVTAVLAGSRKADGTFDLFAAREQPTVPALPVDSTLQVPEPEPEPTRYHHYFALRNPRSHDPSVKKADADGNFPGSGASFEILTPDIDVDFDIDQPLKGILRAG